jgi:2-polyprenyl-6-methoxyphenol hydroxylase-like FAD-dependent oxidoreductase
MAAVGQVLVIGGGFSGMSAAIQMSKAGIQVDLVEIDPHWRPEGAGITINGATLRALETIGIFREFELRGATSNGLDILTPDGRQIGNIPTPKVVGSDVPGGGGIMRPELGRMLADTTAASGTRVRVGCTYDEIAQADDYVDVSFTDGTRAKYDLVVVADGVNSRTRERLFPKAKPPQYVGQCVWRAVLPRPADIARPRMWMGGTIKIGVNPVSRTHMYMFITEARPQGARIDRELWPDYVSRLIEPFPDPILQELRQHVLAPEASIDLRPLVNLLVPPPWNRGRIVMIGDTVAATTPHLAAGAGIGIESGIVLAEELARSTELQDALDAFHRRRWERCRMVVENSERLCRIETENGDKAEHARIMRESTIALTQPI